MYQTQATVENQIVCSFRYGWKLDVIAWPGVAAGEDREYTFSIAHGKILTPRARNYKFSLELSCKLWLSCPLNKVKIHYDLISFLAAWLAIHDPFPINDPCYNQ